MKKYRVQQALYRLYRGKHLDRTIFPLPNKYNTEINGITPVQIYGLPLPKDFKSDAFLLILHKYMVNRHQLGYKIGGGPGLLPGLFTIIIWDIDTLSEFLYNFSGYIDNKEIDMEIKVDE